METDRRFKENKIQTINSLNTDFRAEVVASGLIHAGQSADKTLIIRQRGDKRHVSKDINKIEQEYSTYDLMEYLYIYTNRSSIYDALPEGLFHQPQNFRKLKTQEAIVEEIRSHRNEEYFARKYFQPFEMVLDQLLIDAQEYELKFDKAHLHSNLTEIFNGQWRILKHLSLGQTLLFIKVIPVIAEVSQDLDLMAKVMGIILDCTVSIQEGERSRKQLVNKELVKLGKWKLGVNSVLGKTVESDDVNLNIIIGPISPEQMRLFESNKKNNLILMELINIIVPFDRNTTIKYKIDRANTKFCLSSKTRKAYLGINTTL